MAHRRKALVVCGDGMPCERAKLLSEAGYSFEQIVLSETMRQTTAFRPDKDGSFEGFLDTYITIRFGRWLRAGQDYRWQRFDLSYEHLQSMYWNECGRILGPNEAAFCYNQMVQPLYTPPPEHAQTTMQRLTLLDNDNRRRFLFKSAVDLWASGYSILTSWGDAHKEAMLALARNVRDLPPSNDRRTEELRRMNLSWPGIRRVF